MKWAEEVETCEYSIGAHVDVCGVYEWHQIRAFPKMLKAFKLQFILSVVIHSVHLPLITRDK